MSGSPPPIAIPIREHELPASRDHLIVHYSPLVKFIAGRVGAGLPSSVDPGDLISYGVFGLIDAIERFDPDQGVKFETRARWVEGHARRRV